MANVESLNRTLGRLFNGYMNRKEKETGETYREWTDITKFVREELNDYRKKRNKKVIKQVQKKLKEDEKKILPLPKYKEGDVVQYLLDRPRSGGTNRELGGDKFREGDRRWSLDKKKIVQVVSTADRWRYLLEGIPNASYMEEQLRKVKGKESTFSVKKFIDKRKNKGRIEYIVWWQGYLKKNSTWEPRVRLIEDLNKPVFSKLVKEFEKSKKH